MVCVCVCVCVCVRCACVSHRFTQDVSKIFYLEAEIVCFRTQEMHFVAVQFERGVAKFELSLKNMDRAPQCRHIR